MSGDGERLRAPNPAAPAAGTDLMRLTDLPDPGARGFSWQVGEAVFNAFIVRRGADLAGYVDSCPHVGFPLSLGDDRYLTRDGRMLMCRAHGALFDPGDGRCLAGPARGPLTPWPVRVDADGMVRVA